MNNKIQILFVDDDPKRHAIAGSVFSEAGSVVWHARTIDEGIKFVNKPFDVVCLDHDMGEDIRNGVDVAKALAASGNRPFVWVHSWNIPGARRIANELIGFHYAIRTFSEQACVSMWPVFVEVSK